MSQDKKPIWERQGRPKPPRIYDFAGAAYARNYECAHVYRFNDHWRVWWRGVVIPDFSTFAEAIAYADREARR